MPLVIPNGFAQVAFRFGLENDPEVMVSTLGMDFSSIGGGDQDNLNAVADAFIAAFPAGAIYQGWSFLGCNARVGVAGGGIVTVESPRTHAGTLVGETPPQNCTLLVKKFTGSAGRANRGRMYLPPFCLTEGNIGKSGIIASTPLTELQTAITAWLGNTWGYYILHDSLSPVTTPTEITTFTVDRMIATQRRRLRR